MDKPRIPLQIVNDMISVMVGVRIRSLRVSGIIKFFVDTGSPESFIGEDDAIRMKVPMSHLNFNKNALMGGTKISLGQISGAEFSFVSADGNQIKLSAENFSIAKGAWKRDGIIHTNPSILGADFLKSNNLMLVYYPSGNLAFLRLENTKEKQEQTANESETATPST
ncbi:MAG: hypothetical protein FJY76_01400 [Candidatus Aenigmarchaeota archaeon]|nr:hypothetical protein [Candidatus Aenigmarchaeota archaeon]